jgi:hypothetical protein
MIKLFLTIAFLHWQAASPPDPRSRPYYSPTDSLSRYWAERAIDHPILANVEDQIVFEPAVVAARFAENTCRTPLIGEVEIVDPVVAKNVVVRAGVES